jgi:hypothetical protein
MITTAKPQLPQSKQQEIGLNTKNVLNCYEILNAGDFSWPVNIFRVEFADSSKQTHENRGEAKEIIWNLKKNEFRTLWRTFGFVIDLNASEVAVPEGWKLSQPVKMADYSVSLARSFVATAATAKGRAIIAGVLRESIKKHFKDNLAPELGELWQDFDSFCQYPGDDVGQDFLMCRRFSVSVKALAGGRLVLQTNVATTSVDGKRFADYYETGRLHELAEMIEAKREANLTRKGRPIGVRVLHQPAGGSGATRALGFEDVDVLLGNAQLAHGEQRALGNCLLHCRPFGGKPIEVPALELRLILGSQITQEDHVETILEPAERSEWMKKIRDFAEGCQIQGRPLKLGKELAAVDDLAHTVILPPAVRVRGKGGREELVRSPDQADDGSLQRRARARMDHIRKHGFLVRRPINPALAWPSNLERQRGERLKEHFEAILCDQGIEATFSLVHFRNAEELRSQVERNGYDTVLAVLPEGWRAPRSANDTHEQLKRRLDVPSQCIQHDNTLPMHVATREWAAIQGMDDKRVRRARQTYEMCLGNLLVKHHWFPFAPYDPFHYNVHVGLDVGGIHNTHAVACLGYGFQRPTNGLLFLPEEIPIETLKKEPIPTESLYQGLVQMFERVHSELTAAEIAPDFESVLFHRDGALLGDGDDWNERDALSKLHRELHRRGWVSGQARWTVAEISKTAENWRVFRVGGGQTRNPLVGFAVFPFDDPNIALVATTGSPYLSQGTALPLLVTVSSISGNADPKKVVQDVVWQADLCFSKPDMGMRLPWVLNVADKGALQLSKSYIISGITA